MKIPQAALVFLASSGACARAHEQYLRGLQQKLGDWEFCALSSECNNGCCSSTYSDDGRLKCTPLNGGFDPTICTTGSAPAPAPTGSGLLGDWEVCASNSACSNGCCSSMYSHDGQLKCTPLDGGFNPNVCMSGSAPTPAPAPTSGGGLLGDWEICTSNAACSNGCCSAMYSNDGQLKCTPLDGGFNPAICLASGGPGLLGEGEFCGYNEECSDGCCSTNSDDTRLRCTAVGGELSSSDMCVAGSPYKSLDITSEVDIESSLLETIQDTFDRYYMFMQSVYNPRATTAVKMIIQEEWDGTPGSASGDTVTLRAFWLEQNPSDVAGVTIHELAHIVQSSWQNVPGYFIEGFADFIRDATGVDIAMGNAWSLPDGYKEGQTYTDGYGTTAAFIKWMLDNGIFALEDLLGAFQNGSYSDDVTWPALTGNNLDDLWELYSTA